MVNTENDHFLKFASSLEAAIARCGKEDSKDLLDRQRRQVETLVRLENELRKTLISHAWGRGVYEKFIAMICDERRNILAARPFFRERQTVFTDSISNALKNRSWKALQKFHFNYQFVRFVLSAYRWRKGSKVLQLAREIEEIRDELCVMNMPLAISRAHIFYRRTKNSRSNLTYMDLISIACEGLLSAIDKFSGPFSRVFRAVAIGRMLGYFIEHNSETVLHFYPIDKRKLYRVNKILGRQVGTTSNFEEMAERVNVDVEPAHWTNAIELAGLVAATSCVSMEAQETTDSDEERPMTESKFSAAPEWQPDVIVERQDLMASLAGAMSCLSVLEMKVLRLRGVEL